jgi:hypothetical protein
MTADPLESVEFRIPQAEGRVLSALERGATITGQRFEGNLVYLQRRRTKLSAGALQALSASPSEVTRSGPLTNAPYGPQLVQAA